MNGWLNYGPRADQSALLAQVAGTAMPEGPPRAVENLVSHFTPSPGKRAAEAALDTPPKARACDHGRHQTGDPQGAGLPGANEWPQGTGGVGRVPGPNQHYDHLAAAWPSCPQPITVSVRGGPATPTKTQRGPGCAGYHQPGVPYGMQALYTPLQPTLRDAAASTPPRPSSATQPQPPQAQPVRAAISLPGTAAAATAAGQQSVCGMAQQPAVAAAPVQRAAAWRAGGSAPQQPTGRGHVVGPMGHMSLGDTSWYAYLRLAYPLR